MAEFPLSGAAPRLLDDEAMRHFVREGYVTVCLELPRAFHDRMHAALDPLDEGGPRGHNNLLPCVPELAHLLDEPVVRGALTSILGPDHYLHFHRHDHFTFPNDTQALHKDSDNHSHHAVDGLRRMHRTRFAMLLYYPQDTPLEKGPTGIVPRSQYVPRRALESARKQLNAFYDRVRREIEAETGANLSSPVGRRLWEERSGRFKAENPEVATRLDALDKPWEAAKIPVLGDAGTVTIVHFDMVHGRYGGNTTDVSRHMVKFLYTRGREPVAPSWHGGRSPWPDEDELLAPVWRSTWDWHCGRSPERRRMDLRQSVRALDSRDDRTALGAAYTLGMQARRCRTGLDALFERFFSDDVGLRTVAAYGLVAAGETAVGGLTRALADADRLLTVRLLDLLGDIGPAAVSALGPVVAATRHGDPNVRRYAVEAIGTIARRSRATRHWVPRRRTFPDVRETRSPGETRRQPPAPGRSRRGPVRLPPHHGCRDPGGSLAELRGAGATSS